MATRIFILFCLPLFSSAFMRNIFGNGDGKPCEAEEFQCEDKVCISVSQLCNGQRDCSNGEDETEAQCPNSVINYTMCTSPEIYCSSPPSCLSSNRICDNERDCDDGSDEVNCTYKCPHTQFLCQNSSFCIDNEYRCDGKIDCEFEDDEDGCETAEYCGAEHGRFLCRGSQLSCIETDKVCDGQADCVDASDEKDNCSIVCKALACQHGCLLDPEGISCNCLSGYKLGDDSRTCLDIDECENMGGPNSCSHFCENTEGSFSCSCLSGYVLGADERSCHAEGEGALFIFSTSSDIREYFLSSNSYNTVGKLRHGSIGDIDVDSRSRTIYWTDRRERKVFSQTVGHGNKNVIISMGLDTPEGLAYDWIGKLLYVVDSGKRAVLACTVDGSDCTFILTKLTSPRDIVVDPVSKCFYWTEVSRVNPKIRKAAMDGSEADDFVSSQLGEPRNLVIDYTLGKLFWIDEIHFIIDSINLDGTGRKVVNGIKLKKMSTFVVFEDEIIYSSIKKSKGAVISVNKFTGHDKKFVMSRVPKPTASVIMHPALQPVENVNNPCEYAACSPICLLSSNSQKYTCACPPDQELKDGSSHCSRKKDSSFILVAQKSCILEFSLAYVGKMPYRELKTDKMNNVFVLGYNPVARTVIYSDVKTDGQKTICSFEYDKPQDSRSVIVDGNIGNVQSLAVDWVAHNVFWTDVEKKTIEVAKLDGSTRVVVVDVNLDGPRGLGLDLKRGLLYFSDWGDIPIIEGCDMDGTNCFTLVDTRIRQPNCLTLDNLGRNLFWSDNFLDEIFSIDVETRVKITHSLHVDEPVSLVVDRSMIYWTDWTTDAIHMMNATHKHTQKNFHSGLSGLTGMTLIQDSDSEVENGCSRSNGGCSHICLAKPKGERTCLCPTSLKLEGRGQLCEETTLTCKDGEVACHSLSTCITEDYVCDGHRDCPDNSDESNCPVTCPDQFLCASGHCVPNRWHCDGSSDCPDGSDEVSCALVTCSTTEFHCDNQCLSQNKVCDGTPHCNDRSDEKDCPCESGEFRCRDGRCIASTWVCDGTPDCLENEDESNCSKLPCASTQFSCDQDRCIDYMFVCDGTPDCTDGSDEENNCTVKCLGRFQCNNGECIDLSSVCDDFYDCSFGEDELVNCPSRSRVNCSVEEFLCESGECISKMSICNHSPDCFDGSDEKRSLCDAPEDDLASLLMCEGGFLCESGQCLDSDLVCDGKQDCADGSDETTWCGKTCETDNDPCSQNCSMTTKGPVCSCLPGYELADDNKSCFDLDECVRHESNCSQLCVNRKGGFACSCGLGYRLHSDGHICKALGPRPYLLVAQIHGVRKIGLTHKYESSLINTNTTPYYIDINMADNVVYWTSSKIDSHSTEGYIYRSKMNVTEQIINTTGEIHGLALDWVTNNLYYTHEEMNTGYISLCNMDTLDCKVILSQQDWQPTCIAVHALKGYLFWIDKTLHIERSETDGHDGQYIIMSALYDPIGLTIDLVMDRIYWADKFRNSIETARIDGRERYTVTRNILHNPFSIDLFENKIYISQPESVVEVENVADVTEMTVIQDIFLPLGIKVHHPVRQPLEDVHFNYTGSNPCRKMKCHFICVILPGGVGCCLSPHTKSANDVKGRCTDSTTSEFEFTKTTVTTEKMTSELPQMDKAMGQAAFNTSFTNCSTHCKNGAQCFFQSDQIVCRCSPGYTGYYCEVLMDSPSLTELAQENKAWIAGVVLSIVLIAAVVAGIVCYVRVKRRELDLVSIIKYRNPSIAKSNDEKEELVTEVSFGNPSFQEFDDVDMPDGNLNEGAEQRNIVRWRLGEGSKEQLLFTRMPS